MTPAELVILAVVFLASVVLSGLFSGYETGFVSSNPIRVQFMAEQDRRPRAAQLLEYLQNPDRMLTMLLVGDTLALVMGTLALACVMPPWLAALIGAPVFLILGEILPKSVFRRHPARLSLALLPLMRFFHTISAPITAPVAYFIRAVMRIFDRDRQHISPFMSSLEDVRILVDESAAHGTIEQEEQRMIHSVIDLQNTEAQEVMVPRVQIEALPDTATRAELLATFEETGRTRIPVYRESIDHVIGVINAYDVLLDTDPQNEDITRFIEDVMHVPDTMKLDDLFQVLTRQKQHIAIVADEYGGTDGLITLEDILEEIFGEIEDEHDVAESRIHQVAPNAFVVDARVSLEDVSQVLPVPIEDDHVETVGGWVMRVAARIPAQGEVILTDPYRVTILEGGTNHVARLRLELLPQPKAGDGNETA